MERPLFEEPHPAPRGAESGERGAPLAARMRPRSLTEVVGQRHLLATDTPLRRALEGHAPHSLVLYGPPGSGKTTLARLVAGASGAPVAEHSAVACGSREVRAVIERARARGERPGAVLVLDEIHRFNRTQQDTLLPALEEGSVLLVGATTENPYFELVPALRSRLRIYELRPLDEDDLVALLERALSDPERGIPAPPPVDRDALALIARRAAGDARHALTLLEVACQTAGSGRLTVAVAAAAAGRTALAHDRSGDRHYDLLSALIKALRGSDPDAAVLYMTALLEGGEDPRVVARRLVILASEDIGNADPRALAIAVAAAQAVEHVGMPECAYALTQATIYLALAPKSNAAARALARARAWIAERGTPEPPPYLRDAHFAGARELGRGVGYEYPHDLPDAFSTQELAPRGAEGERLVELSEHGEESRLGARLRELRARRDRARREQSRGKQSPPR